MYKHLQLGLMASCLYLNTIAKPAYKNLVFEGGGIRGIAYAGALEVLEQNHTLDSLERTAGTSVGAIVAALVAVGYDADTLKHILSDLRIQQFNDGRYIFFGGFSRINKCYGWYRGLKLENWIGQMIAAKTGNEQITFRQLHALSINNNKYKDLYITATNLSTQSCTVFSYESYPDMEIRTAIRASISIPLYYSAIFLDSAGKKVNANKATDAYVFVDGGIIANYPLFVFNDSRYGETLGLKLERPEQIDYTGKEIAPYKINSFKNYIGALYNIIIEELNSNDSTEALKTIYISTGNIQPKVRKVSDDDKQLLYQNGINATQKFLKQHE